LGLPIALALLNSMEHKGIIHIFNKKDEVKTGMPDGQDNADSGGNGI
jgi:hypothetical protein